MKNLSKETKKELIDYAIDTLENLSDSSIYGADLHNEIFNSDYFVVGRYKAEQWLKKNYGVFEAINKIKEYEQDNFGEVTTDLSEPENVVNMLVYILGEEILQESITLSDVWNNVTEPEDIKQIIEELKELL